MQDELPNYRQAVQNIILENYNEHGLYYDDKFGIVMENEDKYIDMNEYYLVSQGEYCLLENYEPKLNRTEPSFMNLNKAFIHLKTVFAKLANDAYDLPTFYQAIDLISSLTLMFTIEMEEVMSIIPEVNDKEKLKLIKESFEKCCGKWPINFRKQTRYKDPRHLDGKDLKNNVVTLAAKVSYQVNQAMYFIKLISEQCSS